MVTDDLYLSHYGIFGQKWGRRRFETYSGHLTDAGKQRYDKKTQKKIDKNEAKMAKTTSKRRMKHLMRKNTMLRKTGNLKRSLKDGKKLALLAGTAALAGYALKENAGKGYDRSQLTSEVLKTMGKTAFTGGKKILTSDAAKKTGRTIKKVLNSDTAKKAYKAVGKGIKTVVTSDTAKKVGGTVVKGAGKIVKAGGKRLASSLLNNPTKDFDRDDLSSYRSVYDNSKQILDGVRAAKNGDIAGVATTAIPIASNAVRSSSIYKKIKKGTKKVARVVRKK